MYTRHHDLTPVFAIFWCVRCHHKYINIFGGVWIWLSWHRCSVDDTFRSIFACAKLTKKKTVFIYMHCKLFAANIRASHIWETIHTDSKMVNYQLNIFERYWRKFYFCKSTSFCCCRCVFIKQCSEFYYPIQRVYTLHNNQNEIRPWFEWRLK